MRFVTASLFLLLAARLAAAQPVTGQVASVGFSGGGDSSGRVVVEGRWFPILVELVAQTSDVQQVELRFERADFDGDRVDYVEPLVAVTPGAGMRRVWLYALSNSRSDTLPRQVDLYDEQGILVTSLDVPEIDATDSDRNVVLDISRTRPRGLASIGTPPAIGYVGGARQELRDHVVLTLDERNLPDRWIGLEGVRVVVWDEPNPDLLSTAQLEALRDWVRNGGQLILGVGANLPKLEQSPLAELLPVAAGARTLELAELPNFTARFGGGGLSTPIVVGLADLRPDARSLLSERGPDGRPFDLLALRLYGSGRVVFSAARLRDLTEAGGPARIWATLLDLYPVTAAYRDSEAGAFNFLTEGAAALWGPIVNPTEFRGQAGALILLALLFVGAYVIGSTALTWTWLKIRQLPTWNWPVFALLAALASGVSLLAVELMRGFSDSTQSYQFIDLVAGSGDARVRAYFGYRARGRDPVDLRLTGEGAFLRPMMQVRLQDIEYATPLRYAAVSAAGELRAAPTRATLKQFEGFARGVLDGAVRAGLTADRGSGRITPESWVEPRLGLAIDAAYLLYIDPRLSDGEGVPVRAAGLTQRSDRADVRGSKTIPPAMNVLCVNLGALGDGQRVTGLGAAQYAALDRALFEWRGPAGSTPRAEDEPLPDTLWSEQNERWAMPLAPARLGGLLGMGPQAAAGFLASTRGLYLANPATPASGLKLDDVGLPVTARGLMELDVTHWLISGEAVLLLYADDPGPIRLQADGVDTPSSGGSVLVRVRVPLEYTGRPPRPATRSDG